MKIIFLFIALLLVSCGANRTMVTETSDSIKSVENSTIIKSTELEIETQLINNENGEALGENDNIINDTIVDKYANYSKEVQAIIEKYNGQDTYKVLFDGNKFKNYEELKKEAQKLADEGLYIVGFNTHGMKVEDLIKGYDGFYKNSYSGKSLTEEEMVNDIKNGNIQIMTWDEAVEWGLNYYKKYGESQSVKVGDLEYSVKPFAYGVDNQTYDKKYNEYASPITNASHLYNANYQHEVYTQRQEYLNQYVLRNETAGSPAKFINALGGREYFRDEVSGNVYTKDGQQANFDGYFGGNWCKSRGVDPKDYQDVEMIVFKKNNPDVKFGDLPFTYTKYKTYHQGGEPRWIEKDINAWVYNVWGVKEYPQVYKSFDDYLDLCGGSKINGDVVAFQTYSIDKQTNRMYNWYYNYVLEDGRCGAYELSVRGYYLTDNVETNPYK